MTTSQIFDISRFFKLTRTEMSSGYKLTLIVAVVVFLFLLFLSTIMAMDGDTREFHEIWYSIILLGGGFYFTSTIFDELNRKEQRLQYLTTPASLFEKFSLKLLITTVGWIVGVTLLYWVFAQVADWIAAHYFSSSFSDFEPFNEFYRMMIAIYISVQSLFLLGAATFNRFSFFKTLFSLNLLGFVLLLFLFLIFRILFASYFDGFVMVDDNIRVQPSQGFIDFMEFKMWPLVQFLFWYVLPIIMWVVAFFKLKEREV